MRRFVFISKGFCVCIFSPTYPLFCFTFQFYFIYIFTSKLNVEHPLHILLNILTILWLPIHIFALKIKDHYISTWQNSHWLETNFQFYCLILLALRAPIMALLNLNFLWNHLLYGNQILNLGNKLVSFNRDKLIAAKNVNTKTFSDEDWMIPRLLTLMNH